MVFIVGSLAVVAVSNVEGTLETSATFGIIVLGMLVASAFAPFVYIDHVMYPSCVDRWLTALERRVSAFKQQKTIAGLVVVFCLLFPVA